MMEPISEKNIYLNKINNIHYVLDEIVAKTRFITDDSTQSSPSREINISSGLTQSNTQSELDSYLNGLLSRVTSINNNLKV